MWIVDSLVVANMINGGGEVNLICTSLVFRIQCLLQLDWEVILVQILVSFDNFFRRCVLWFDIAYAEIYLYKES